jgi:hypothetical protein
MYVLWTKCHAMAVQITTAAGIQNLGVTRVTVLHIRIAPRLPEWQAKALYVAWSQLIFKFFVIMCVVVRKMQRTLVNWAERDGFENLQNLVCANLDTGAHAGPVLFVPHEKLGTESEFLVLAGHMKLCFGCPRHVSESSAKVGNKS